MSLPPYEIISYDIDRLKGILARNSEACLDTINKKLHSVYFEEYFTSLNTKTIVVESEYIDKDYLDDFMAFYANCFSQYKRRCSRLHFLDIDFTLANFDEILQGKSTGIDCDKLNAAYLGFMVVKPLPQTVIGRTCLKTYDDGGGRRHYSVVRNYVVSLFGIPLNIKSLAFQEQDHVVSACATSALWSVFHGTGMLYPILSPADITKIACDSSPMDTRHIPNQGLSAPQMAQAIRKVELEPFLVRPRKEESLKSTLYAYLKGGVPVLMGELLVDGSKDNFASPVVCKDRHAVAVTGYSSGGVVRPHRGHGFLLKASQIDKIYVHDDQVGPFSRRILDMKKIRYLINGNRRTGISMLTSWIGEDGNIGGVRAIPELLLMPLYHKIRIPFECVHDVVMYFDGYMERIRSRFSKLLSLKERMLWDIYLINNNEIKTEILNSGIIRDNLKKEALEQHMPRYIWRASASCGGRIVLDLLFDATGIEQAYFLEYVIGYDQDVFNEIVIIAKASGMPRTRPEWKILHYFNERP